MAKTMTKSRRNLRRVLYTLLAASFLFAATATATYAMVRTKTINIRDITPALFEIDIASHHAQWHFQNDEGQFKNALELIRKGFFAKSYDTSGQAMMRDLAYTDRYPPAQFVHANIVMMLKGPAGTGEAMMLYQDAADKGYEPARLRLAEITGL